MAVLKPVSNGVPPHPGVAVARYIERTTPPISQSDLARATGITFQRINGIVRGRRGITTDSALRLEQCLGLSAQEMLRAQAEFDLYNTQAKIAKSLKKLKPFQVTASA